MHLLRALSRSVLLLALVAACSSSGSATTAPPTPAGGSSTPAAAATPAGPQATAPGTPSAGAPVVAPAPDVDPWARNAVELNGKNGQKFAYPCPPNGTVYTIWGTDTYTDDSSVCTAGVHAGVVTLAGGGYVVIQVEPGQDNYTGSARNGITSSDYAAWGGSYVILKP
jgi:hypothetical protein